MKNGLIIPCYNESSRLDLESYLNYATTHKDTLLCFVNDGSSDMTRSTLADLKNLESDNIHIFNIADNAGKAAAVRQGALYLYNETDVDTIGFIDADLSTGFDDYHGLVNELNQRDNLQVIYGSRAKSEDNKIERDFVRGIISAVIRLIILFITRVKIQDTQCGAKVFDRILIPSVFDRSFKTKWLFDVEIILRLKIMMGVSRFKSIFLEKPLKQWIHMDGSKLGLKDSIQIPLSLLRIWFHYNVKQPFHNAITEPAKVLTHSVRHNTPIRISLYVLQVVELVLLVVESQWFTVWGTASYIHLFAVGVFFFIFFQSIIMPKIKATRRWRWMAARFRTMTQGKTVL